jgi:hypothetical protein
MMMMMIYIYIHTHLEVIYESYITGPRRIIKIQIYSIKKEIFQSNKENVFCMIAILNYQCRKYIKVTLCASYGFMFSYLQ